MIRHYLKDALVLASDTLDGEARKNLLRLLVSPHEVIDRPAAAHHQTYRNRLIDPTILGRGDLMALRRGEIPVQIPLDLFVIEDAPVTFETGESVSLLIVGTQAIAIDVALALASDSAPCIGTRDKRSAASLRALDNVGVPFEMVPTISTRCDDWAWHIRPLLPRSIE